MSIDQDLKNLQTLTDDFFKTLDFYRGQSDCIYDNPEPANPSTAYIDGRTVRYALEAAGGAE